MATGGLPDDEARSARQAAGARYASGDSVPEREPAIDRKKITRPPHPAQLL
jgi:hypothetical protein